MKPIYDMLGEEIKVGSLIAFNAGSNSKLLRLGIVIKLKEYTLSYLKKTRSRIYEKTNLANSTNSPPVWTSKGYRPKKPYRKFIGYGPWKVRINTINLDLKSEEQNRIIVLRNPLFLFKNPYVASQLEVMDLAKSAGVLPQDYSLGRPIEEDLNSILNEIQDFHEDAEESEDDE